MTFVLHPKLEADSAHIVTLPLCEARLSLNAAFPWVILIPRITNAVEIIDLSHEHQIALLKEIELISRALQTLFQPVKLNVANLGNIVSQLHVHVIARYTDDLAWPNPVWNSGITKEYSHDEKIVKISQISSTLQALL